MLARTRRGLGQRRNQELSELLYQGCLLGMMALPLSVTHVTWRPHASDHGLRMASRARAELRRGHAPGLVRDVLLGLATQETAFAADPILICQEVLQRGFHYGAHTLLVVVLRMYRRDREALAALEELEAHPISLRQRAMCMGNRGFILFSTERKEEAYQAYAAAAQMSQEPHHEVALLLGELMRGDEARAIESGARLEAKIKRARWQAEASIEVLAQQMRNPIWQASPEDVRRIHEIKGKLSGMPALIADILSTIKINHGAPATTPGAADIGGASAKASGGRGWIQEPGTGDRSKPSGSGEGVA